MARSRFVVILAKSKAEGYRYAKRADIPARYHRIPTRASQVVGVRAADIHILPSFQTAPQRHSILRGLAQARGHGVDLVYMDVEMPPKPEVPVADQGDGMGQQLTIDEMLDAQREMIGTGPALPSWDTPADPLETLLAAKAVIECNLDEIDIDIEATVESIRSENPDLADAILAANPIEEPSEPTGESEPSEDAGEDDPAPKRRRTRCADCGELRFPEDHECSADAKSARAPSPSQTPRERLTGGMW